MIWQIETEVYGFVSFSLPMRYILKLRIVFVLAEDLDVQIYVLWCVEDLKHVNIKMNTRTKYILHE